MSNRSFLIKEINNRINSSHPKLKILSSQKNRDVSLLDKMIEKSIPKLNILVSDSEFHKKKNQHLREKSEYEINHAAMVREQNFILEKQIAKEQNRVYIEKNRNYHYIKQQSRKNQKKFKENKEKILEQKRNQIKVLKSRKQQSRKIVRQFHQKKQLQLRRERELEELQRQMKLIYLAKTLAYSEQQENNQRQDNKVSKKNLESLRKTIGILNSMKHSQFKELTDTNIIPRYDKFRQLTFQDAERVIGMIETIKENI